MKSQLPCPDCQTSISFDVNLLLAGQSFACPRCQLAINLDPSSKPQLSKAVEGFNELQHLNAQAQSASARAIGGL